MIKNATEMKNTTLENEHYKKGFEQAINSVMRAIERASNEGKRKTCFNPTSYHYETEHGTRRLFFDDEVKAEFIKHGYTFEPTGYIGGVWQRTENICW